jgi:predicted metal-dependent enzyme (double-stranded beta helix superfamily)
VSTSVGKNLWTILAEESGEIIAVGFDEDSTRELVEILAESDESNELPKARLLVREDVLKWVRDDFRAGEHGGGSD